MSTRKLSVLVACLVFAVVLCLRWYLEVEGPTYAAPPELYDGVQPEAGCADAPSHHWSDLSYRAAHGARTAGAS